MAPSGRHRAVGNQYLQRKVRKEICEEGLYRSNEFFIFRGVRLFLDPKVT